VVELVIFDVDGTLVETYTLQPRPNVHSFFRLALEGGCPLRPKVAIATNQGGVGMRYWMETAGFGKPEHYPTEAEVARRMQRLVASLGGDGKVPVYLSFRYRTRSGRWTPIPAGTQDDPRWSAEWRKPLPGMLLQAMADAGSAPERTLFVGDRRDDQEAASAAGCAFAWAGDFFVQEWRECSQIARL
jgi:D-glycero-D-manno-heptose 1,7-bisphosphate phosphatase